MYQSQTTNNENSSLHQIRPCAKVLLLPFTVQRKIKTISTLKSTFKKKKKSALSALRDYSQIEFGNKTNETLYFTFISNESDNL